MPCSFGVTMSPVRHCPACALPVSDTWVLLAKKSRADDPVDTHVCPACTLAMTGEVWTQTDAGAGYRARAVSGPSASEFIEDDEGTLIAPDFGVRRDRLRQRVLRLREVVRAMNRELAVDLLDVGCKDGVFASSAAQVLPVTPVGLEPWLPWRKASENRGVPTIRVPLERWVKEDGTPQATFDVITDVDLLCHLPDPIAHLAAVAARLRPHGVAIIEVPNLLGAAGKLDEDILRTETPWTFTPRSLATACRRAGLMPVHIEAGPAIIMHCRPGAPSTEPVGGPDALTVAHLAWGNDLRLSAKRTLARLGPSARVVRGIARIHRKCPIPDVRADLAIEIASALERCGDYGQASSWLRLSLQDRHDPEVLHLLDHLRRIQVRMNTILTTDGPQLVEEEEPQLRLAA